MTTKRSENESPHARILPVPPPWWIKDQMLTEDGFSVNRNLARYLCPHCGKAGEEKPAWIQVWAKGWGVCHIGSFDPVGEHDQHLANAYLIAKAPELWKVLQEIIDYAETEAQSLWSLRDSKQSCEQAEKAAQACERARAVLLSVNGL